MINYLAKRRKELNLTQTQVANAVNINIRLYQKYEYGDSLPSVDTAINIAKFLDTTVEQLFPLSENN